MRVDLWNAVHLPTGHTWSKAVELWCDAEARSESELLSLAKLGRLYPDRHLSECSSESFEQAILSFTDNAGTYTRYRTMVTAILNLAKARGLIEAPPKLATKKDKKKKPRDWITREEWQRLYAELPSHMKPMARFAILTGLRQANVLKLTWSKVDLRRKLVWVEAEDMKADDALAVPLTEEAVDVLLQVQGQHPVHVFTYRGRPISEVKTSWMRACDRAGLGKLVISKGADGKRHQRYSGFTWHGLRHTWATWHVQRDPPTPLEVLQKLGGWKDMRMVLNYAHHSAGHLAKYA